MIKENIVNYEELDLKIKNLAKDYCRTKLFPHVVIDNFLKEQCIQNTLEGFKTVNWASYTHF